VQARRRRRSAKCDYVKSLGADEWVDYKADDFAEKLKAALPEHADVFFDNVGGKVLDTGFTLMKRYGFIGQCGAISGECAASAASELHATIARTTLISRLPRRAARAWKLHRGRLQPLDHQGWVAAPVSELTAGMIVLDHAKSIPRAVGELKQWVEEGKLDVTEGETVVDTKFEDVPKTWQLLFTGGNKGKLVTKLVWAELKSGEAVHKFGRCQISPWTTSKIFLDNTLWGLDGSSRRAFGKHGSVTLLQLHAIDRLSVGVGMPVDQVTGKSERGQVIR
jgi:hypothetical protein